MTLELCFIDAGLEQIAFMLCKHETVINEQRKRFGSASQSRRSGACDGCSSRSSVCNALDDFQPEKAHISSSLADREPPKSDINTAAGGVIQREPARVYDDAYGANVSAGQHWKRSLFQRCGVVRHGPTRLNIVHGGSSLIGPSIRRKRQQRVVALTSVLVPTFKMMQQRRGAGRGSVGLEQQTVSITYELIEDSCV